MQQIQQLQLNRTLGCGCSSLYFLKLVQSLFTSSNDAVLHFAFSISTRQHKSRHKLLNFRNNWKANVVDLPRRFLLLGQSQRHPPFHPPRHTHTHTPDYCDLCTHWWNKALAGCTNTIRPRNVFFRSRDWFSCFRPRHVFLRPAEHNLFCNLYASL